MTKIKKQPTNNHSKKKQKKTQMPRSTYRDEWLLIISMSQL